MDMQKHFFQRDLKKVPFRRILIFLISKLRSFPRKIDIYGFMEKKTFFFQNYLKKRYYGDMNKKRFIEVISKSVFLNLSQNNVLSFEMLIFAHIRAKKFFFKVI